MVEINNVAQPFEKPAEEQINDADIQVSDVPPPIFQNPNSGSARIGELVFRTTGALNDNVACTTSEAYVKQLIHLNVLPSTTEYFIPPTNSPIRADWHCEGWVCLYEFLFRFGMTVPLSPLSADVMRFLSISPGQLMPAGWKLIQGIEDLGKAYSATIRIADLKSMYSSKTQTPGRVHFRVRNQVNTLVNIGQTMPDEKNWKAKYFFVRLSSLGPACAGIQCRWKNTSTADWGAAYFEPNERVRKFLEIPKEKRTWPECLWPYQVQEAFPESAAPAKSGRSRAQISHLNPEDTATSHPKKQIAATPAKAADREMEKEITEKTETAIAKTSAEIAMTTTITKITAATGTTTTDSVLAAGDVTTATAAVDEQDLPPVQPPTAIAAVPVGVLIETSSSQQLAPTPAAISTPAAQTTAATSSSRRIGAAVLLKNIRAKTSEASQSSFMDIDPIEANQEESKQVESPSTLDILAGSPPPKDYSVKKRKLDSLEESVSQEISNPFSPVKLQSVGKEEVLKIESCYESWTETNSIARAMEVVGAATQLAKQVTYLGCVICRSCTVQEQLLKENDMLTKEKTLLESKLVQKESSLFIAEDQFRTACKENAAKEEELVAVIEENKSLKEKIKEFEKLLAENKADANFSIFLGRVSMLKDIEKEKTSYVLADQLATLRKEFPDHREDINDVFGPESQTITRESRTLGQHAAGLSAEGTLAAVEQEAHSDPTE